MTSTRARRRPTRLPHPDGGTAPTPLTLAARSAPTVLGLLVDTAGHLHEVAVPTRATGWALAGHIAPTAGPAAVTAHTLDQDLIMWATDDDPTDDPTDDAAVAANPAAAVAAAAFGHNGPVHGPVVFTGWTGPRPTTADGQTSDGPPTSGQLSDVTVAAVILLAGIARSCDLTDTTAARAAEFTRLGIHLAPAYDDDPAQGAPGEGMPGESFDALAHTVTRDGDLPRCAHCWGYGSHPEHQPEALAAEQDTVALAATVGVLR